jgi:predicted DNA binding CopG/RHH family protein
MITKKDIEKFDDENELWDSRQLGASAKNAKRVSDEEDKAIDDALGLQLLSFRIQRSVIEQLKELSKLEGIGYQPLMRQILTKYVRENQHKLESLLSPQEAAEQAEQYFIQAIDYRENLHMRQPMTQGRLIAENDYAQALDKANGLFTIVLQRSTSPVLKKHAASRLNQIKDLLAKDVQERPTKKPRKTRKRRAS